MSLVHGGFRVRSFSVNLDGIDLDQWAGAPLLDLLIEAALESAPSGDEAGFALTTPPGMRKPWEESKHPRIKGKFAPSPGAHEERQHHTEQIHAIMGGRLVPTGDHAAQLAHHLSHLTTEQLHGLKRQYGHKASGRTKDELVKKLSERFAASRAQPKATATEVKPAEAKAEPLPASFSPKDSGLSFQKVGDKFHVTGHLDPHRLNLNRLGFERLAEAGKVGNTMVGSEDAARKMKAHLEASPTPWSPNRLSPDASKPTTPYTQQTTAAKAPARPAASVPATSSAAEAEQLARQHEKSAENYRMQLADHKFAGGSEHDEVGRMLAKGHAEHAAKAAAARQQAPASTKPRAAEKPATLAATHQTSAGDEQMARQHEKSAEGYRQQLEAHKFAGGSEHDEMGRMLARGHAEHTAKAAAARRQAATPAAPSTPAASASPASNASEAGQRARQHEKSAEGYRQQLEDHKFAGGTEHDQVGRMLAKGHAEHTAKAQAARQEEQSHLAAAKKPAAAPKPAAPQSLKPRLGRPGGGEKSHEGTASAEKPGEHLEWDEAKEGPDPGQYELNPARANRLRLEARAKRGASGTAAKPEAAAKGSARTAARPKKAENEPASLSPEESKQLDDAIMRHATSRVITDLAELRRSLPKKHQHDKHYVAALKRLSEQGHIILHGDRSKENALISPGGKDYVYGHGGSGGVLSTLVPRSGGAGYQYTHATPQGQAGSQHQTADASVLRTHEASHAEHTEKARAARAEEAKHTAAMKSHREKYMQAHTEAKRYGFAPLGHHGQRTLASMQERAAEHEQNMQRSSAAIHEARALAEHHEKKAEEHRKELEKLRPPKKGKKGSAGFAADLDELEQARLAAEQYAARKNRLMGGNRLERITHT